MRSIAEGDAAVGRGRTSVRRGKSQRRRRKVVLRSDRAREEGALDYLAVNTESCRSPSSLPLRDEVVPFERKFQARFSSFSKFLIHDAGEGMLLADPGFVVLAPLKERKGR